LSQTDDTELEKLLIGLESEIARKVRRSQRRALWDAVRHYRRSHGWLEDLLPPDVLALALQDQANPSVTWQVLRHLCRHIRFNACSPLGSAPRLKRCRTIAAGEINLLFQQRTARQDRRFIGGMLADLCQVV